MINTTRPRRQGCVRPRVIPMCIAAVMVAGLIGCRPRAPQNWRYNTVTQAESSATFGAHNTVEYRYNGRRIEVLSSRCAADNWYSGLRYTGRCTAVPRNGRLEVRWGWIWTRGAPPTARSLSYQCDYNVSLSGRITELEPPFMAIRCETFRR